MGGMLLRLRAWWETADRTTKTVTIVGGGLFAALLVIVFYTSSTPNMEVLFPRLEAAEQGRIIQKLQELKVPYQQDSDGSILVPAHQVMETRAKLAVDGIPTSGALGNVRLDSMGFTDPAALQDEKLRVAKEEELEKTINFMSAIASSKVHITPGTDSPFADLAEPPSASVLIQLRPGVTNGAEVAETIVHTVTGAVQGLKPENVSVSDAEGTLLWDGTSDADGGTGIASKKRQAELAEAARLEREIQAMIGRVVGSGKATVSAVVEMNFDTENVSEVAENPTKNATSSATVTESLQDGSAPPAGGVASAGGAPAIAGGGTPGSGNYQLSQSHAVFGGTKTTSQKIVAPGKITAARVSILLDQSAAQSAKQIEQYASNLIGADGTNPAFKVALATAAFDQTAAEETKKQLASAQSGQLMQRLISLIPVLALVVVGFLVVKAIAKTASNNSSVLVAAAALPGGRGGFARVSNVDGGGVPSEAMSTAIARPADVSDEQASHQARVKRIRRAMEREVAEIPEKFDAELEAILLMADERPESVALLVKSWLLEETR